MHYFFFLHGSPAQTPGTGAAGVWTGPVLRSRPLAAFDRGIRMTTRGPAPAVWPGHRGPYHCSPTPPPRGAPSTGEKGCTHVRNPLSQLIRKWVAIPINALKQTPENSDAFSNRPRLLDTNQLNQLKTLLGPDLLGASRRSDFQGSQSLVPCFLYLHLACICLSPTLNSSPLAPVLHFC